MIKLIAFNLINQSTIRLFFSNGFYDDILLLEDSGKVAWRYKYDTAFKIEHTCIILGYSLTLKQKIVIHNHRDLFGTTGLSPFAEFAMNQPVYYQEEECTNSTWEVITIALNHVIESKPYSVLYYNCQTLSNTACYNKPVSQDVNKWTNRLLLGGFAYLFIKGTSANRQRQQNCRC